MASSILTNTGAMTALQSLQMTQKSLLDTQNRISTGLKVNSAKDNAATWAVATTMRTDIANFKQVSENLSTGSSVVGTAQSGAEQIASLVGQIKAKITAAQDPSKDKAQIQADIDVLVEQITSTSNSSAYNGVNLLNNTDTQSFVSSVNNVAGVPTPSYIEVQGVDFIAAGEMTALADIDVSAVGADYATMLNTAEEALKVATGAAAKFGTAATRIDTQKTFMDKLVDTLTTGVGALVDADMSAEAARLQALQVQQQLGTQALSIANQAPQSILSLFGR